MKGKEGLKGDALRLIWLKGGLWRGGVGGGLHPEINEVLSFNVLHMWERPAGLCKGAKSYCQGCSRCERPHSPFYYPLSHICKDSNEQKWKNKRVIKRYSPTYPKWKQLRAINFSRHVWILAALITDGWSNFSSASESRFLLKRAICSDSGWLRGAARCHTNPVECLHWTEGLWDCQDIAWPIRRWAACQLYAYGIGKAVVETVAFKQH